MKRAGSGSAMAQQAPRGKAIRFTSSVAGRLPRPGRRRPPATSTRRGPPWLAVSKVESA